MDASEMQVHPKSNPLGRLSSPVSITTCYVSRLELRFSTMDRRGGWGGSCSFSIWETGENC